MKLISWNVNGIRACLTKGFEESFGRLDADIFCIQAVSYTHLDVYKRQLFNCEKNLYGRNCTVQFKKFLRPEHKFPSFEALKAQISKDIGKGREFFKID